MKLLISTILFIIYFNANGQNEPKRNWIDSEIKYTDAKGNLVAFTHSFPRGGGMVTKNGKKYNYVVFWTRILNESKNSAEINIQFPEVTYLKSPESYIHIVLPNEKMNMDKIQIFDYGLINLQAIFNEEKNQLKNIQKKIQPNEDYIFYTVIFMHIEGWGPARTKFEIKDQNLFYKISLGSDTSIIPVGRFIF